MSTLALVSCVSKKQNCPAVAEYLYTSPWFRKAREYAISIASEWYILSAKHGFVHPSDQLSPYNTTLLRMKKPERRMWAEAVLLKLSPLVFPGQEVVILAGARYREFLIGPLEKQGAKIETPLANQGIGQQLAWLNRATRRVSLSSAT